MTFVRSSGLSSFQAMRATTMWPLLFQALADETIPHRAIKETMNRFTISLLEDGASDREDVPGVICPKSCSEQPLHHGDRGAASSGRMASFIAS